MCLLFVHLPEERHRLRATGKIDSYLRFAELDNLCGLLADSFRFDFFFIWERLLQLRVVIGLSK